MRELHEDDRVALEAMIDVTSLSVVLDAISDICVGKAIHLQENWQEPAESPLTQFWRRNAISFEDHKRHVEFYEKKLGIAAS